MIMGDVDRVTLYEEYRLIEKSDPEINGAWKGAHLLLFFLSFVFGSFCTFCFHVLMYLFDDKCVLFPKLLSIKDLRRSSSTSGIILDFIAHKDVDALPVDFVTTQWVDKSVCYLPTYVPLVSGICGLVWTTMFLMCSSGSRTLTGLQRPWRILPSVFIFSLAMAGLCIYTSVVTQYGLQELCTKLGEITGSSTCTYTINVATLAYERRIRGVYQATRLTMLSAWLHTGCWVGAAGLALARVILVVDFRLVRIRAELRGNIEKMLERHEKHIRTDEFSLKEDLNEVDESIKVRFVNKGFGTDGNLKIYPSSDTLHYFSQHTNYPSQLSLLPEEQRKLYLTDAARKLQKQHRFLLKLLYDIVDTVSQSSESTFGQSSSMISTDTPESIKRQFGRQNIAGAATSSQDAIASQVVREVVSELKDEKAAELATIFRQQLGLKLQQKQQPPTSEITETDKSDKLTVVNPSALTPYESFMNITPELQQALDKAKKSNLKSRATQTEAASKRFVQQKVQIYSPQVISNASLKTLKDDTDTTDMTIDSNATIKGQDAPQQPMQDAERKLPIVGLKSEEAKQVDIKSSQPKPQDAQTKSKEEKASLAESVKDTEKIKVVQDASQQPTQGTERKLPVKEGPKQIDTKSSQVKPQIAQTKNKDENASVGEYVIDIERQAEHTPSATTETSSQLRQRVDESTPNQTTHRSVDKETQRTKKEKQD